MEAIDVSEMADLYEAVWHHVPADRSVPLTVSSHKYFMTVTRVET